MLWWVWRRKVHISWLLTFCCAGILLGVFLAQYVHQTAFSIEIIVFVAIILAGFAVWRKNVIFVPLIIFAGFLFGFARGSVSQQALTDYQPLYNKQVTLTGTVTEDVDIDSSNQLVIRLGEVNYNGISLPSKIWLTASGDNIKRGDKIVVSGVLKSGFGNFAGVIYRGNIQEIIHPQPGDVARIIRDWFADAIRLAIPDPQASLGVGYLVGQRRALPIDLASSLQIVGLTHVVVASGYNLTVLVRLTRRLFAKVSKYLATFSAISMVFAFIAVTGLSPSMSRAGLVTILSLLAWYYGRKFHPVVLLLLAMATTVLINPDYLWGDLGWQLSFTAFAGVMILAPLLQKYLMGDKKVNTVGQVLFETVSAQIMTAPIIVLAFGQFSNVAIITNLLVLPFVPLAMLLTFIAGLGGLILPAIAGVIGAPANWLLSYMIGVVDTFAELPWASSELTISGPVVLGAYLLIIGFCVYCWRKTKYNLRTSNLIE